MGSEQNEASPVVITAFVLWWSNELWFIEDKAMELHGRGGDDDSNDKKDCLSHWLQLCEAEAGWVGEKGRHWYGLHVWSHFSSPIEMMINTVSPQPVASVLVRQAKQSIDGEQ